MWERGKRKIAFFSELFPDFPTVRAGAWFLLPL
jgi:hypothetical protein